MTTIKNEVPDGEYCYCPSKGIECRFNNGMLCWLFKDALTRDDIGILKHPDCKKAEVTSDV